MTSPIKKFQAGGISVAVWENEPKTADGNAYQTVSLQKRFKDKNDEWKTSNSFRVSDLPKAILALQKAYEFLALKEPGELVAAELV